jgi:large subunit ribosomal protein L6
MAKNYRPLVIPAGADVVCQPGQVVVKGKLGMLTIAVPPGVEVKIEGKNLIATAGPGVERVTVGTTRAHILNAFTGVLEGYLKVLEVRGMGYRVQKTKDGIQILCGYSHPVDVAAPAGVKFEVGQAPDPSDTKLQMFEISVSGIDKQMVGEMAAEIRANKPPDNYQGKGIRYRGEHVRKKAGKRAAGTQA